MLLVGFSRTSARLPSFDPAAAAAGISSALRSDGLHGENVTVQSGAYSFFFLADCAKHKLPSCFALNADSPYGLTSLPKAPGEKQYRGCVTKTGRCGDGCNPNDDPHLTKSVCPDGMPMQWRLGRDEAVLLIGRTPPKAKYWSITPYVMSQWYGPGKHPRAKDANFASWIQKLAVSCRPNSGSKPGGDRCQKFASLNQPFNFNAGGFGQPFALVLTASQNTYVSVHAAIEKYLQQERLPTLSLPLHLFPIPLDIVNLGTDNDEKDMLTMLMRTAYPDNATEMSMYYDETPIEVLRVTPTPANNSSGYYTRANATFLPRLTGKSEAGVATGVTHEELVSDLESLGQAIEAEQNKRTKVRHADSYSFMKPFFKTGLDCIDDGTECNGDCADTLYPISGNIYKARQCRMVPIIKNHCHAATIDSSPEDHFVVYGVNHAATGLAEYASITAYDYDTLSGLVSKSSEDGYAGSADRFLPGGSTHRSSSYLFAYSFARNCTKATGSRAFCFEVPSVGDTKLPLGADMFWIERMYVSPVTGTGPAANETIMAKVKHFY